jgi:hypothetical protein
MRLQNHIKTATGLSTQQGTQAILMLLLPNE